MTSLLIRYSAIALFLACIPLSTTTAGELSIIINGKSYHIDSTYDWNEDNYGIGVEYEFASASRWKKTAMANGFRDSNDTMSYMAGAGLHRRLFESNRLANLYLDLGITAFLMTRDDVDNGAPFPGVLPSLRFGNRYAGINLTYLPKQAVEEMLDAEVVDPTIDGIVFMQFKVRFGKPASD